ncbi:hypothetical protein MaudMau93_002262 [Microsporum audouinii]
MASIQLPLEAFTSRLNLGERLNGIRSQSMSSRFANLRPVSEFLDIKRVSKPANFSEFQSRASYNLSYFSSNYVVVFIVLSIYSLLTNLALLFVILLVLGGSYGIGKLEGRDLDVGVFRATTSQLYTALLVVALPLGLWASPLSTALWLTSNRECFFGGGGLGGRPRAPCDVPLWGRPLGALRAGKSQEIQINPVESDSEEDGGDEGDQGVSLVPFIGDKAGESSCSEGDVIPGEWSESDEYEDKDEDDYSDNDDPGPSTGYGMHGLSHNDTIAYAVELAMRDDDDVLVENALEKIRYARTRGQNSFTLTDREVAALDRRRRRNAEVELSRPQAQTTTDRTITPPRRETKQRPGSSRKRRPSDSTSVADMAYTSAYLGHYSIPASPVPSHSSIRRPSNKPHKSRSQASARNPLDIPPPQPQFYAFSPHPPMPPTPATASAIPLSVPQSPYPMYPRPAYPPPAPNIMCQPIFSPSIPSTYMNHPSPDPFASYGPRPPLDPRTTVGSKGSDNGTPFANPNPNSKTEGLAHRAKTVPKTTSKMSRSKPTKAPDTPAPEPTTPTTSTATETSKSPSPKSTITAGRNGFIRPKRKKHRWF